MYLPRTPQQNINTNKPKTTTMDDEFQTPPAPTQLNPDFTRWVEQFDDQLFYIEHALRGEVLTEANGQEQWERRGIRLLNEKGIQYIITQIRTFTNKNTYMSYIRTEQEINKILKDFSLALLKGLSKNADNFNLYTYSHIEDIMTIAVNYAELSLRRSINGGERNFLTSTRQDAYTVVDDRRQQHNGILKFFGR